MKRTPRSARNFIYWIFILIFLLLVIERPNQLLRPLQGGSSATYTAKSAVMRNTCHGSESWTQHLIVGS